MHAAPPCRLLYDLFTNIQFVEQLPPVLVACHKADVDGALAPADVRSKLEAALCVASPSRSPPPPAHAKTALRWWCPHHRPRADAVTESSSRRRGPHSAPPVLTTKHCAWAVRGSRLTSMWIRQERCVNWHTLVAGVWAITHVDSFVQVEFCASSLETASGLDPVREFVDTCMTRD